MIKFLSDHCELGFWLENYWNLLKKKNAWIIPPKIEINKKFLFILTTNNQIMKIIKNFDYDEYYTNRDPDLLASNFVSNLAFLSNSWSHLLGRPTICLLATHLFLGKFFSSFDLAEKTNHWWPLTPRAASTARFVLLGMRKFFRPAKLFRCREVPASRFFTFLFLVEVES